MCCAIFKNGSHLPLETGCPLDPVQGLPSAGTHLTEEETETQRGEVTCPRPHSKSLAKLGSRFRSVCSPAFVLSAVPALMEVPALAQPRWASGMTGGLEASVLLSVIPKLYSFFFWPHCLACGILVP